MLSQRFRSICTSTIHRSRVLSAVGACLVAAACGDAATGTPTTPPLEESRAAIAATVALEDARDRILPALDDQGYAEALRGPLGVLGAALVANDTRGAQIALVSVRQLLVNRPSDVADAELSALELAVENAAATIQPR